ncbi:MAG: hypothetical protein HY682_11870 [Chloroflexi bacterium]|nr:hypothetical protein [Chloroflexota bacterium]
MEPSDRRPGTGLPRIGIAVTTSVSPAFTGLGSLALGTTATLEAIEQLAKAVVPLV